MKKLIMITAFFSASVANAQLPSYTLANVAAHATATDCWMVLNTTKVYNFTPFVSMHPGGSTMVPYCGKDGASGFASVPHTSNAVALEATYLIGTLVTAPLAISVTITPTNANTNVGGTVQFKPTVANSTAGVAWTVAPSTLGSISASGLFTALAVGGGTVTASSLQDTTKSASASVTVSTTPPPPPHMIGVTVNPSAASVNVGSKVQFKATLTNSTSGVTWSTTGSIGTIDKSGVFTAGLIAGTGTVTATSVDDPTKKSSAQVTITTISCAEDKTPPPHHDD